MGVASASRFAREERPFEGIEIWIRERHVWGSERRHQLDPEAREVAVPIRDNSREALEPGLAQRCDLNVVGGKQRGHAAVPPGLESAKKSRRIRPQCPLVEFVAANDE